MESIKILAIADQVVPQLELVEIPERFRDVDLILSCGDLPFDYLEYLVSRFNKPLYYVYGNHGPGDMGPLCDDGMAKPAPEGCGNIHRRVVNHKGLLIAGLEGSLRYNNGPHQYSQGQMRGMIRRMMFMLWRNKRRYGRALDILITHAPPWGIHDEPDLPHQGFRAFLPFIERYKPRYLIHGHIHLYRSDTPRVTKFGETTVINAYGYQLLEIDVPSQE
jgi:uncharacterized protein